MGNSVLAIIPARGGSKGIPGKNLVTLAGKPLIQWTIEAAKSARCVTDVAVSSDSHNILRFAREQCVYTIERPGHLASDLARTEPVLEHAVNLMKSEGKHYSYLLLLQGTSPLRTAKHIDEAFDVWADSESDALISVCEPRHHPLKAFLLSEQGFLKGILNDQYPFMPRQELPAAFLPNGAIYFVRMEKFMANSSLFQRRTCPFVMSLNESVDIDCMDDIALAESILKSQKNGVT